MNNPCGGLPGLTHDRASDLSDKANTDARVKRVRDRYGKAIWRHCREVVGFGIGQLGTAANLHGKDRVLVIYLKHGDDLPPDRSLFLHGVPLRLVVTGEIRAQ